MFENSVNTAHYSVDLRPIKAKFVGYNDWAPPPVCLPSVYPLDYISQALHTESDQKLKVGTTWEQSYYTANTVVQFGENSLSQFIIVVIKHRRRLGKVHPVH